MKAEFIEIEYDGEIFCKKDIVSQYKAIWNLQGLKALIKEDYTIEHRDREPTVHHRLIIHYKHNLTKTLVWKSPEKRDEVYERIRKLLPIVEA